VVGCLAFMTGGHLTVGGYGDGLIARIGVQDMDAGGIALGILLMELVSRLPWRSTRSKGRMFSHIPSIATVRTGIRSR
jgi:hypothetical protein